MNLYSLDLSVWCVVLKEKNYIKKKKCLGNYFHTNELVCVPATGGTLSSLLHFVFFVHDFVLETYWYFLHFICLCFAEKKLKRREVLMNVVNKVASILLDSEKKTVYLMYIIYVILGKTCLKKLKA